MCKGRGDGRRSVRAVEKTNIVRILYVEYGGEHVAEHMVKKQSDELFASDCGASDALIQFLTGRELVLVKRAVRTVVGFN